VTAPNIETAFPREGGFIVNKSYNRNNYEKQSFPMKQYSKNSK
jgi:hypothetical protein